MDESKGRICVDLPDKPPDHLNVIYFSKALTLSSHLGSNCGCPILTAHLMLEAYMCKPDLFPKLILQNNYIYYLITEGNPFLAEVR